MNKTSEKVRKKLLTSLKGFVILKESLLEDALERLTPSELSSTEDDMKQLEP